MKRDALVGNFIRRTHCGRTGVVIVELPEDESAIGLCSTTYVDYARRTEIGPSKFLFARPDQLHRFSGSFRKARRFDGRFAGVLASICRASIRHNHPDTLKRKPKSLRKFFTDGKRPLSSSPHRQFPAFPFGDGSSRL